MAKQATLSLTNAPAFIAGLLAAPVQNTLEDTVANIVASMLGGYDQETTFVIDMVNREIYIRDESGSGSAVNILQLFHAEIAGSGCAHFQVPQAQLDNKAKTIDWIIPARTRTITTSGGVDGEDVLDPYQPAASLASLIGKLIDSGATHIIATQQDLSADVPGVLKGDVMAIPASNTGFPSSFDGNASTYLDSEGFLKASFEGGDASGSGSSVTKDTWSL